MIARLASIELASYWLECISSIKVSSPLQSHTYRFGEKLIAIDFYQDEIDFFTQAIAHLRLDNVMGRSSEFLISVVDTHLSQIRMPIWLISKHHQALQTNHYAMSEDANYILHYHLNDGQIQIKIINRSTKSAIIWCNSYKLIPTWEKSFPFRQVLYHFFNDSSYCLIHGAGVGINADGVLLTAKGGSGKSTTALACLSNGWQYIGDDFILLDTNTNYMYSLYNVAKLEPHQLAKFPKLAAMALSENQDMQKQQLFLFPDYRDRLCHKMKLKAIVTPRYNSNAVLNSLESCSAGEALLSMAPSTIFLLKADNSLFKQLSKVCKSLPAYKLTTANNLDNITAELSNLL